MSIRKPTRLTIPIARPSRNCFCSLAIVQVRIQARVVVHLHLPVGAVTLSTRVDILEQLREGLRQIRELQATDRDPMRDLVDVRLIDIATIQLLLEMVDAKRHDRQSVDGAPRSFGVQPSSILQRNMLRLKRFRDPVVDFFDPVIPRLIVFVNVPFDASDLRI